MPRQRHAQHNAAARSAPAPRADPVAVWLNGGDSRDVLCPEGYTPLSKNEDIRKCVHRIADLVSSMTIRLMENGERGDIRLKNALSRQVDITPSRIMSRKNFIYKIVTDMCVAGNAVVFPKVTGDGLLDDLQLWKPEEISYRETSEGYAIRRGGREFSPDELLHFVLIPDDDYAFRGNGYTGLIGQAVQNLLQANATKTGFLKSKWKPSMIISTPADIEEIQDPKKRNAILGSYTKTTEIGEPWLIPAGEIEVKTVQPLTLNDLAIQDSITLDKRAIAAAVGVPAFMVGIGEFKRDEYNNFVSTVIMPIAQIIQQELTRKLVYKPEWYFSFSPKSLMQYELKDLTDMTTRLVAAGVLNRNEARDEVGYTPVEGLDEYIVLENYIPVAKVGDQKKLKGEADE